MRPSCIADILETAGARAAFDVAWPQIESSRLIVVGDEVSRKEWLARIVRGLYEALPGQDVAPRALQQFFATVPM